MWQHITMRLCATVACRSLQSEILILYNTPKICVPFTTINNVQWVLHKIFNLKLNLIACNILVAMDAAITFL